MYYTVYKTQENGIILDMIAKGKKELNMFLNLGFKVLHKSR